MIASSNIQGTQSSVYSIEVLDQERFESFNLQAYVQMSGKR